MTEDWHRAGLTLRAAAVLPIGAPAIRDAGIHISRNRVKYVCRWRELPSRLRRQAADLGEVLVLPGLVNAHCHLDYTQMAGQLPPQRSFTDWLKLIVSQKAEWGLEDYAKSWENGAEMLLRSGTTTVADIEAVPALLPRMWERTPLRVFSFLEMLGISRLRSAASVVREAIARVKRLRPQAFRVGLSPHSPYSTCRELLERSARAAARGRLLVCTHVAESLTEAEMFRFGRGDMHDWLERSGRDMSDCGIGSPIAHLHRCGMLGPNFVAVHANYLARGDLRRLAEARVQVVHCPRSHFYFKHRPFQLRALARAGVNIALGTDSLASVYKRKAEKVELDMFAEMREVLRTNPGLSSRAILRMATANGARMLGLEGEAGVIAPGSLADIIVLPKTAKRGELYRSVIEHEGPVERSMINGRWVFCRGAQ